MPKLTVFALSLAVALALSACGGGGGSSSGESTPQERPGTTEVPAAAQAVQGLSATPGNGRVTLTWQQVAGATAYEVYQSTTAGAANAQSATPLQSVTEPTATITGLSNGTTYYFNVRAVSGDAYGDFPQEVSAQPLAPAVGVALPGTTQTLSATPANGQVQLSWAAVSGADSYDVYLTTAAGVYGQTPVRVGVTATTSVVDALTNGTTYYFTVRGVNARGAGAASNEASATPLAPQPVLPTAVQDLRATPGNGQVVLAWTAVNDATGYDLYQSTTPGVYPATASLSTTGTNATLGGLVNGTPYYYIVRARNAAGSAPASNEVNATPAPNLPLDIASLELAQTHVLPEAGKSWMPPTPPNASSRELHAIGGREALALVRFAVTDANAPILEGIFQGASLGSVALAPPSALPATEAGGAAYASDLYSARVPAAWMKPGLQLGASAQNYLAGALRSPKIGADVPFTMRILPFYVFGASEATFPLSQTGVAPQSAVDEMFAKWPAATLDMSGHPAGKVVWPYMIISPRAGGAAYRITNKDQQHEGYATMSAVLQVLGALRVANGDASLPVQYYAPLIMLNAAGNYAHPGGGLGGGSVGTGDFSYTGIYIHEAGHAFGIPHVGSAFDAGEYPYSWGSLNGSLWGFDQVRNEFLATFVPATASRFANCRNDTFGGLPRPLDGLGRCIKQDPMQSGSGDQAAGYRYATFSDYSTAIKQDYLESKVLPDAAYASGFKRWDKTALTWVEQSSATQSSALYGFNENLPVAARNVPVHAIMITYSYAEAGDAPVGAANAVSQIYPPLSYIGNRIRYVDPTDPAQLALLADASGREGRWFCKNGGCDYTVRVTYADDTTVHIALNSGFRSWFKPADPLAASVSDPLSSDSFARWAVHVPGDKALKRIELLHTPILYRDGFPASPVALLRRDLL